jgi:triosephosphate isomerase (TIM)
MRKIIIGNLKMNLLSPLERDRYLKWMDKELKGKNFKNSDIVLCPAFVHLEAFKKWGNKKIKLGAQNFFPEEKGSYTGEVSPVMLKNYGCEFVIIGHSERKRYFSENNHEINLKMNSALKSGLKPILCVGETKIEKENHETLKIVAKQVREALENVSRAKAEQIIITYEPIWAVGSDDVPSANEIMGAKLLIKKILVEMFGKKYADLVRIIYGGSVSPVFVKQVCIDSEMEGALIGRESLQPHGFVKVAEIMDNC